VGYLGAARAARCKLERIAAAAARPGRSVTVIPQGNSIEDQLARYEIELRTLHRDALASEATRDVAEKQIAASLASKGIQLAMRAQGLN
jgi:hypothetical protein